MGAEGKTIRVPTRRRRVNTLATSPSEPALLAHSSRSFARGSWPPKVPSLSRCDLLRRGQPLWQAKRPGSLPLQCTLCGIQRKARVCGQGVCCSPPASKRILDILFVYSTRMKLAPLVANVSNVSMRRLPPGAPARLCVCMRMCVRVCVRVRVWMCLFTCSLFVARCTSSWASVKSMLWS